METTTINVNELINSRTEIRRERVWEFEGKVRIKYYWDSHGKLSPFETSSFKNHTLSGKFYIEEVETETDWKYGGKQTTVSDTLYCNGQKVEGEAYKWSWGEKSGTVTLVIGWG